MDCVQCAAVAGLNNMSWAPLAVGVSPEKAARQPATPEKALDAAWAKAFSSCGSSSSSNGEASAAASTSPSARRSTGSMRLLESTALIAGVGIEDEAELSAAAAAHESGGGGSSGGRGGASGGGAEGVRLRGMEVEARILAAAPVAAAEGPSSPNDAWGGSNNDADMQAEREVQRVTARLEDRDRLEQESGLRALKKQLRAYEETFKREHGRRPGSKASRWGTK